MWTHLFLFPPSFPTPYPPPKKKSVWEINFEVLGEVACVCEGRRWGRRRWWKEFSLSTRQPGSKLFIPLVVERGPAHMFLKKSLANRMVQLLLLFVNTFRLQSWWTETEWQEDDGTGHGWSGSGHLRLGAAPTPLPSSLSPDFSDASEKDFAVPRESMSGGMQEPVLSQNSKILYWKHGSDNAQPKFWTSSQTTEYLIFGWVSSLCQRGS